MIRKIKENLSVKLFLFLTIIILLSVVPLTYIALKSLTRYGSEASRSNELQIRSQAISNLQNITRERADRYDEFFKRIEVSTALLGQQASTIYSDLFYYAENPIFTPRLTRLEENGMWISSIKEPVTTLFWDKPNVNLEISTEMMALTHMKPLMLQLLEGNPEAITSHVITKSGMALYSSKNSAFQKTLAKLPPGDVFDLRDSEPVTLYSGTGTTEKKVQWTDIYLDFITDRFILTASTPIYDITSTFRGITGVDVPLDTLRDETINYTRQQRASTFLFTMLLDGEGRVIALPKKYYSLMGLEEATPNLARTPQRLQTALSSSSKDGVRKLAKSMQHPQNDYYQLTLEPDNYLVITSRVESQSWVFGVVVKESELLASVRESRQRLDTSVRRLVQEGTQLALITILIALVIIYILLKFLITPLRNLADATQQVAAGDLTVRSPVSTSDEAGVLAKSFNSMVQQLQIIQDEQKRYAESLKLEVINRNLELVSKKKELETTIELLNSEVERRQIISEALRNNQKQYYDSLESMVSGVYIIEEGVFSYVNDSLATSLFRRPKDKLIGSDPLQLVAEEDRSLVAMNIQRRLQGMEIPPYTVRCLRGDGTTFYGEVWSKVSTWRDKKVMVGTVSDVSSIKHKEEILQIQDRQLQKSLDEKEILLKEIYHRTKNNMLVIISILELQALDINDTRLKRIFQETENRIRTMALVHEKLYQSQNLSEIDMGSYLLEVANSLLTTMVLDERIHLKSNLEPIAINIDFAVPLGLVVNEIITNSIKHAFPENRDGTIYIHISKNSDNDILMGIGDDGIGLPKELDIANNTSFGLGIIITSLVKLQLKGDIDVDCSEGTYYTMRFPEPKAAQRI